MVQPDSPLPPALRAALRAASQQLPAQNAGDARSAALVPAPPARGYYMPISTADRSTLALQLAVTRALLLARTPEEIPRILETFVRDLGGNVFPALLPSPHAIPLDISLGLTPPVLPHADPVSPAAMQLTALLPQVVEDARIALSRLQARSREAAEAERDGLTGLLTRRAWMRVLSAAKPGDALALVDLDWFKTVNDTLGHAAGDAVLQEVTKLLAASFRDGDACGRYGGDEFVVLAPRMPPAALADRLDSLRAQWHAADIEGGSVVGLSVGVTGLTDAGPQAALRAADRALYRAKAAGRDRTELATAAEQNPPAPVTPMHARRPAAPLSPRHTHDAQPRVSCPAPEEST